MKFKLPERYQPTNEFYEGGQGVVCIYDDRDLDRKVAVKFLKSKVDQSILLQEMASLRSIRSKHIGQIYDLSFQNGTQQAALVQEYVPGDELWTIVEHHQLTCDESLRILFQIASGIADIHAAGKIHRDIKPSNIKRDSEGIFKLLDFGLACDARPNPVTVQARGTIAFRAPEMYGPGPVNISTAVDTYAFGITAICVFSSGTIPASLTHVPPSLPAPSFLTFCSDLHPEIVKLLDATLASSPKDRPPMSLIRDRLAAHLLFGQHRALVTLDNGQSQSVLSKPNQAIRLTAGDQFIEIMYDGLSFRVQRKSDGVFVNNVCYQAGAVMPESCVIALHVGATRVFYLFDVSHPEVVL